MAKTAAKKKSSRTTAKKTTTKARTSNTKRSKAKSTQSTPSAGSVFFFRRLTEFIGLALICVALFTILAIWSYVPQDPSANKILPDESPTLNITGPVGAWIADPILQFAGGSAYLLLIIPLVWGLKLVRYKSIPRLWLRVTLLCLCIPITASAFSGLDYFLQIPELWPTTSFGGFLGGYIKNLATPQPLIMEWYIGISTTAAIAITFATLSLRFHTIVLSFHYLVLGVYWILYTITKIFGSVATIFRFLGQIRDRWKSAVEGNEYDDDDELPSSPKEKKKSKKNIGKKPSERALEDEFDDAMHEEDVAPNEEQSYISKKSSRRQIIPSPKEQARKIHEIKKRQKSDDSEPQTSLDFNMHDGFQIPSLTLLKPAKHSKNTLSESALSQNAEMLEKVLEDFGVKGQIIEVSPGPVVTLYALEPAAGVKSSRVIGLADDIARSMSAVSARIAVVPGKNAIGIELPNNTREMVFLREILESKTYKTTSHKLPLALGKDIAGKPVVIDLAKTPHLLVAGTTGSGKSVGINTMILSLLYKYSPQECRFIMIDPKMLELSVYQDIPHLLTPVVTEPSKAVVALKWTVREMENRYRLMSNLGVRNVYGYNQRIAEANENGEILTRLVQTGFDPDSGKPTMERVPLDMTPLPFIVVIVDEMADLMLVAGKEIETSIQRLAQMARAAGIHIILATQRPSVDVITGIIKANFPTRLSFQVTSKIDSRTILGEQGAEQLLGMGDMLYMAGGSRITRVHGPFVDDKEVEQVVSFLKEQGTPEYIEEVMVDDSPDGDDALSGSSSEGRDELFDRAVAIVAESGKASTSFVQRSLKIGYNRAANIIDQMEREGIITEADHVGRRKVLAGNNS